MKLFNMFFLFIMLAKQCSGGAALSEKEIPECVQKKVENLQEEMVRNPPAYVASYQYKGRKVYYIPPAAGDQMSELYTADCELICRPEGGIIGRGDGRCPDFLEERSEEEIIWKDERK